MMDLAETIARELHARYEWWAPRCGWTSQVGVTAWEDVPEANRETMLATVRSMLETDVILPGPAIAVQPSTAPTEKAPWA